LEFLL